MGLIGSLTRRIGRLLECSGRGFWVESFHRQKGIFFYLFGESAEVLAGCFPNRASLRERTAETGRDLRLVFFTDRPAAARALGRAGHLVNLVDQCHHLRSADAMRLLLGITRCQMSLVQPQAVFYNPEFPTVFRRAKKFTIDLGRLLGSRFARSGFLLPTFLAGEADMEFGGAFHVVEKLPRKPPYAQGVDLFYFGAPQYFDYEQFLQGLNIRHSEPLGWRSAAPRAGVPSTPGKPKLFVWFNKRSARRDLLHGLDRLTTRDQFDKIVAYVPTEFPDDSDGGIRVQRVAGPNQFLDLVASNPGLVIADGGAPLLRLLDAGRPVVLIRNAQLTSAAVLKIAYFEGQNRWPCLEKSRDLIEALSGQTLDQFWAPYQARACSLERESDGDLTDNFIRRIYLPICEASLDGRKKTPKPEMVS